MKIGVCGIACEKCPKMQKEACPNGSVGCVARENKFAKYVIVLSLKLLNSVLNAQSFHVKQLRRVQSVMVTVGICLVNCNY